MKKSGRGSEMYDYIYAEVKNIDLTKYPNSALKFILFGLLNMEVR